MTIELLIFIIWWGIGAVSLFIFGLICFKGEKAEDISIGDCIIFSIMSCFGIFITAMAAVACGVYLKEKVWPLIKPKIVPLVTNVWNFPVIKFKNYD